MKLIDVKFGKQAPDGLASDLRELADAVDRGELNELIGCYILDGEFNYLWAASLGQSVLLSDLLHAQAISRMRQS